MTIEKLDYAGDIRMFLEDGIGGVSLKQNDLERDGGLETAVLISLFSDQRVTSRDVQPDASGDLRGWWGDSVSSDPIGSKIWLLSRSVTSDVTYTALENFVKESLNWMIVDGIANKINATVAKADLETISIEISLQRPKGSEGIVFKYYLNWESQSLRRGV